MSRRAKGTGGLYKNKEGYWVGQIIIGTTPEGKTKYKRFMNKSQAVVIEKMKAYELQHPNKATELVNDVTLEEYMRYYLVTIKKNTIKPASYDRDYETVNRHICPRIGHYYLKDITSDIIQNELIGDLLITGYSYSTIHKAYVFINETLKHAMLQDRIIKNPCIAVKLPKKENIPSKDIRCLTDEEIEQFKKQANITYKSGRVRYIYGNILCLILYTGLRGGELCSLKWKDIDYTLNQARIDSDIQVTYDYDDDKRTRKLIEQETTKNGKIRFVPLNKKALEILEIQRKFVGGDKDDYIITGTNKLMPVTTLTGCYKKIAEAAKIKNALGVHTLRHTFASRAIRKGIDIKVVSEILGHSSITFTYNTYIHIIDEQKKNAVDLLDDI